MAGYNSCQFKKYKHLTKINVLKFLSIPFELLWTNFLPWHRMPKIPVHKFKLVKKKGLPQTRPASHKKKHLEKVTHENNLRSALSCLLYTSDAADDPRTV